MAEFHPLIKGVGRKKHYKTSGLGQSTPLIRGVNLHPLNWGGMGFQGDYLAMFSFPGVSKTIVKIAFGDSVPKF